MANQQEHEVEHVMHRCRMILLHLTYAGLTQQELEDQQDFWQGKLTTAEERLYALRHGDKAPTGPMPIGDPIDPMDM